MAQKNVYTLLHEKYYSIIVTTVFIQKQNWCERCPYLYIILHSHPEIEISFKFIPKILMSKECIHFLGHSVLWVCVCSLGYQARTRVPCCIMVCGLSGFTISLPIISQTARFSEKMLVNTKCVFWFYLQRLSEKFLILRRIQRDIVINVHRPLCKVPYTVIPRLTSDPANEFFG